MIVAHGSRTDGWAQLVEGFAATVRACPGIEDVFSTVCCAFLESCQPRLAAAVRLCLSSGGPQVLVAPLFLTVSTHLAEDIPGILGLDVPDHVRQRLRAEGHDLLVPGIGGVELLDLGDLSRQLLTNIDSRVAGQSDQRAEEAVVLCGHGSSLHHARWESLMGGLRRGLLAEGYAHAGHAYVGHSVGMSPEPTRDEILKAVAIAGVRRVHVVPLLVGVSGLQHGPISEACAQAQATTDVPILYGADAILPDTKLAAFVANTALRHYGAYATVDRGVLA